MTLLNIYFFNKKGLSFCDRPSLFHLKKGGVVGNLHQSELFAIYEKSHKAIIKEITGKNNFVLLRYYNILTLINHFILKHEKRS